MTLDEIRLRRLTGQHLLSPAETRTVVRDLCGVQAQFLNHALHGLSIRCGDVNTNALVKSWTIRGTMHLFAREDLPLFLHEGRGHSPRPVDNLDADAFITRERKAYFADLIVAAIAEGTGEREELKKHCEAAGMTESEGQSLFDPWGGIIRALCDSGRICHKVQEKKAYQLCPPFEPMAEAPARLEMARRYFTNFGPATMKDAAYFFGRPQSQVKTWLAQLPVVQTQTDGKDYFYIDSGTPAKDALPACLFLAGFDQLMLGYEKTESLFLPREHLRGIFNLAGIVRPALLVSGQVVGWWNKKNRTLKITLFAPADRELIQNTASQLWSDLKRIEFQ